MHFKLSLFILNFLVLFSFVSYSQSEEIEFNQAVEILRAESDSVFRTYDELVNGRVYYQKNLYAANHPFFLSYDWIASDIMINGTTHQNEFLKYNIETNELILRAKLSNGSISPIVLNNGFVDSFLMYGHLFVQTDSLLKKQSGYDLAELIYAGDFSFYATYQKKFITDYNTKTPYGKYSAASENYFLEENGTVTKINNAKALVRYFEADGLDIRKTMKKLKFKFGKANKNQWIELLQYCDREGGQERQ